jgi:hypothetical protein
VSYASSIEHSAAKKRKRKLADIFFEKVDQSFFAAAIKTAKDV